MTPPRDHVQRLLEDSCREHRMPGASAAWLHDGQVHFACFGTAVAAHDLPVTQHTLFGIGSTSKTLAGTAMMALVEQGKVSLDDRVVKHLPDLPVLDEQARDERALVEAAPAVSPHGWAGNGSGLPLPASQVRSRAGRLVPASNLCGDGPPLGDDRAGLARR